MRICPNCGRQVTGRADKRFCCSECRTMFHNKIYTNGERNIPLHRLYHMGFDFKYLTSFISDSGAGGTCVFECYDYTCALSSDGRIDIDRPEPATPR